MFDKDQVKNNLSIEQVRDILAELGGEHSHLPHHMPQPARTWLT